MKQEISSEVGFQTGDEGIRSVDCLRAEMIWGAQGQKNFLVHEY